MISSSSVVWRSAAGMAAATLAGGILYITLRNKFKREYVKVGKVSKLITYPIKSGGAYELETAECTKSGIKFGTIYDRMWAVVDEKGVPLDLKLFPRLVLLHTRVEDDRICIDGPDMETLKLTVFEQVPNSAKVVKCNALGTTIEAVCCGEEAAKWFQQYIGRPDVSFVQYVPGLQSRPSQMKGLCKLKGKKYPILFQGDQSYLVVSEASVEEVNTRTKEPISHLNYRCNIVISDCQAFDEDKWKYMKIGETATFVKTVACNRCVRVRTDPKTGDNKTSEALSVLWKFRQDPDPKKRAVFKSPVFGMNYGLDVEGKVSVGDDVYVVYD